MTHPKILWLFTHKTLQALVASSQPSYDCRTVVQAGHPDALATETGPQQLYHLHDCHPNNGNSLNLP
jgi:hypothetical protein